MEFTTVLYGIVAIETNKFRPLIVTLRVTEGLLT